MNTEKPALEVNSSINSSNQSIKARRKARKLALQALYQQLMTDHEPHIIEAEFHTMHDMSKVDAEHFHRILHGVKNKQQEIESAFEPFLDRPLDTLNPIELVVLRLAAFELIHCPELPFRVVLDEAVSLCKTFGSQDGHRYVNGVLNNLARLLRPHELDLSHE